jgi:hypothetical protein
VPNPAELLTVLQRPAAPRFGAIMFDDVTLDIARTYLVKGLLDAGSLALAYGETGCGKTFVVLDLSLHVALGWSWHGRRVQKAGVIYVAAEGGSGVKKRLAAFRQYHTAIPAGVPFVLIPAQVDLLNQNADLEPLIQEILTHAKRFGTSALLVVVDTLSRVLAGGNENAPDDMGGFVRNIDCIRAETGACCLIVHHAGKDGSQGARGHSLLRAAVDTELQIERGIKKGENKQIRAAVTKQKDGESGAVFGFRLEQLVLGTDEDGDRITSCVVVPSDAPAKARKLSDREQLTLQALQDLIVLEGEKLPQGTRFPTGGHHYGVRLSRLREEFHNRAMSGTDRETSRKAFLRVRQKLQAIGKIGVYEDWVWLPGQPGRTGTS